MMDVYEHAIAKWGISAQLAMFAEECSEASAAAIRFLYRDRGDILSLAAEVADVEIMAKQIRIWIGDDIMNAAKNEKIQRLDDLLHAESSSRDVGAGEVPDEGQQ